MVQDKASGDRDEIRAAARRATARSAEARDSRWRAADIAFVGLSALLVTWLPNHWAQTSWSATFDVWVFALVGPLLAVVQWQLSQRVELQRERRAWQLLAAASLARSLSGLLWGEWGKLFPDSAQPWWLLAAKWLYLVFTIGALLTFPSAPRRPAERPRQLLELATALVGSAMVSWYFALGPFFSTRSISPDFVDDLVHAAGDSLCVALAAAVHLRAAHAGLRRAALWLLLAAVVQLAPDIWFWGTPEGTSGRIPDLISLLWLCVWLLKWAAARAAIPRESAVAVAKPGAAEVESPERTVRSPLPTAILLAATALQILSIVRSADGEQTWMALGSLLLAILLVLRQYAEMRERDRFQQALSDDTARQRALLNRAYDAIVLLDRNGALAYASPSVESLLTGIDNPSRPWAIFDIVHPDDRAIVQAAIDADTPGARPLRVRLRDRAGTWRIFDGHLQDLRQQPFIEGFVLNGFDRTRELQLEAGLRDAQQFEALGVMASGLAHDLGNTLTVVASHVELMTDDASMSARAQTDLQAIRAASDRARALTTGLLALSRRKSASKTMVAADAIVLERLVARGRRVTARIADDASGPLVRVNREALTQLVDVVFDEAHAERSSPADPVVTVALQELRSDLAGQLHIEHGRYLVIGVGDAIDVARATVRSAVHTDTRDEWDLSPGDLALLMAMAAAREIGGTVTREQSDDASRYAIYVPTVAA